MFSFHLIFIVIFNIFLTTSGGVSGTPVESGVEFSVTKINDAPLSSVTQSSILDFAVVLDPDINCVYMHFMIGVNSLFIKFVNMT